MKEIYIIQSLENGYYKIGISKNPKKRIKQLQTGNSSELKLLSSYKSEFASIIEKTLHNNFSHCRKEGEWFDLPLTEALDFKNRCNKIEENIVILKNNDNVFI